MLRKAVVLLLIFSHAVMADFQYSVNNSNFIISQGSSVPHAKKSYTYNYNRLRLRGDYKQDEFFITAIGDGVNYLGRDYVNSADFNYLKLQKSDTPFKTQTTFHDYSDGSNYLKLYRFYGGYEDDKNRVVAGVQNISMGVGHIWTPTNLFNPKNSYALEPDETFGVAALSYTRYLNDMSNITVVASEKKDDTFKYAARYKTFLDFADFALDAISSNDTKMIGYEIEGNLYDSGIELRSEGAYIKTALNISSAITEDKEFYQAIFGADYGFVNGLNVAIESYYSSKKFSYQESVLNADSEVLPNLVYSNFYTGMTLSYSFNIFLDASLLYIESFNDKNSRFISPALTYTLNNYNSFSVGAMVLDGSSNSEFGRFENTYYFKYMLSF
jgi:hypothetical protein